MYLRAAVLAATVATGTRAFLLPAASARRCASPPSPSLRMSSAASASLPTWSDLQSASAETAVGGALGDEADLRPAGRAAPFVQNRLRMFDSEGGKPRLTLYRDHAGWCPYCQKTMLLIEEKEIPIQIELVPMRSYGDKPREFLNMVPSGLLPALRIETEDGGSKVITESQVIMDLLDRLHPPSEGYRKMMPSNDDAEGGRRYMRLADLERELFSWWCTLIFRPEGPRMGGGGLMGMLGGGGGGGEMSGAMRGFLDCLDTVDAELTSTAGPWFFDEADHPTMIDFVYVSHVERMLASAAFWKGLDLRSGDMKERFPGLNAWLDAFEKREAYLAFKSDYYTHVMDIPPQYGPGYDGGFEEQRKRFSDSIRGRDGKSWTLPLPFDDEVQPLYKGPPLPLRVLEAAGIVGDHGGAEDSYERSDPLAMAQASRQMAGWKLASNGEAVARFAARGGSKGAANPRKTFGAELADPYAAADADVQPHADAALRAVASSLLAGEGEEGHAAALEELGEALGGAVPSGMEADVISSLSYLRDRIGVPRDLPLASARQLRAHLNYAIDALR